MFSLISLIYKTLSKPVNISIFTLLLLMLFSLITWAALFLLLKHTFNYYFPHMGNPRRGNYPAESFDIPVYTCTSLPDVVCKTKDDPPNYYDVEPKLSKSLPSYEEAKYMGCTSIDEIGKTELSG